MKVLDARVYWAEGWNNSPSLQVLVDEMPKLEDLRYEQRESIFYAELGGYVSFYCHDGSDNNFDGYGGRHFEIIMADGSPKTLRGPWSSRSAVVNQLGFPKCMEVDIFITKESWDRGYTAYAGDILVSVGIEAVKQFCPSITMEEEERHGEVYQTLRRVEDPCAVCKGAGKYHWYGTEEETCRWCGGTGHESDHKEGGR